MGLLAVFAALLGLVCVPLALTGGTAWLLLPAHLVFSAVCVAGSAWSALVGRPSACRAFGIGHVLASVLIAVAFALGSSAQGDSWYWIVPWAVPLFWVWIPGAVSSVGSELGASRRHARNRRVVRRRRRVLLRQASTAAGNKDT